MLGTNNITATTAKLIIGIILFFTWIVLVCADVKGDEQLIDAIKYALAMLGGYHAGDRGGNSGVQS